LSSQNVVGNMGTRKSAESPCNGVSSGISVMSKFVEEAKDTDEFRNERDRQLS